MRHFSEFGRGGRGGRECHGERECRGEGRHGGGGGFGGGRRQRFFGHGELRLVVLDILSRNASHGYELIKEIENMTQGSYSPSPGVIYPTLDLLQDQGLITIQEEDGGRKKIAITGEGSNMLAENKEVLEQVQLKLKARMVGHELRKDPQMKRALENFKAVLNLKVNQSELSDAQLKQIVGVIDRAALEISQLD
ncbi:PadR family transcriptional regulator [Pseudocitrobacter faecalis]|uniref:PadR family transcriptional regulator n=1 Tax=Pseudocitrobacter faecalis TaxID=1398493 RepID=UPI003BA3BD2B